MIHFAVNHMTVARLSFRDLVALSSKLGCMDLKVRNDLPQQLFDSMDPAKGDAFIRGGGLRRLALAEVKPFYDGSPDKETGALALMKISQVDTPIPVRNMSGGKRQRVSIARTAALGVRETPQVENIFQGMENRGIPTILISRNLRQVLDLVERIAVFLPGRMVATLRRVETGGNDIESYITGVKGGSDAVHV